MIDDPATVERLMAQLKAHLPIAARPSRELRRTLRRGGVKAGRDRPLRIKQVFYTGDEGGICCDITPDGSSEVFIVSLTHLEVDPAHPLAAEIRAYQRHRTLQLALQRL